VIKTKNFIHGVVLSTMGVMFILLLAAVVTLASPAHAPLVPHLCVNRGGAPAVGQALGPVVCAPWTTSRNDVGAGDANRNGSR
jgi:hypothetical protein